MNKKLIRETISGDQKHLFYSEEFYPQDVKIKYFKYDGNQAIPGDNEEIKQYSFECEIFDFESSMSFEYNKPMIMKVLFPELDYLNKNGPALVKIEYVVTEQI